MKNLSFINKIIYLINNIFALLFLASFAIPHIAPKTFPLLSVLSLAVPFLILIHVIFIIYWWIIGVKKQFLLSALCIALAVLFSYFPYKFSSKKVVSGDDLAVMSYNVRMFNRYNWIDTKDVPGKINDFVKKADPDILSVQEYYVIDGFKIDYPYKYTVLDEKKHNTGQAIFSKFRIINKGSLGFKNSNNNAIFIDVIKGADTIRIYNIHLETTGIKPSDELIGEEESKRLIGRISKSFVKQQDQVEKIRTHKNNCTYKVIITGDFNNTAYSWAYHHIKGDMKDSFLEAGEGFGGTYNFHKYPLRIDFILVDKKFNVNQFTNFDEGFSDHLPIMARISH
ncbi:MAG: endonuclease [Flavobacteriia bacterium]|nr:MAG: endonuclease [Flavobacteriia bacterium]